MGLVQWLPHSSRLVARDKSCVTSPVQPASAKRLDTPLSQYISGSRIRSVEAWMDPRIVKGGQPVRGRETTVALTGIFQGIFVSVLQHAWGFPPGFGERVPGPPPSGSTPASNPSHNAAIRAGSTRSGAVQDARCAQEAFRVDILMRQRLPQPQVQLFSGVRGVEPGSSQNVLGESPPEDPHQFWTFNT